jgi:hypothetical protein
VSPLALARANGYGRIAIGLGLVAAPSLAGPAWIGEDGKRPAVSVFARALGARDLVLGFLTVHTAGRPGVGPRTLATVALVDAVDCAATAAVRSHLPAGAAAGAMAVAGTSAVSLAALALATR